MSLLVQVYVLYVNRLETQARGINKGWPLVVHEINNTFRRFVEIRRATACNQAHNTIAIRFILA